MTKLASFALSMALITAGCDVVPPPFQDSEDVVRAVPGVSPPSMACPWIEEEHYGRPAIVTSPSVPPAPPGSRTLVAGCAIVTFLVAPDGRPVTPILRAAYPLNAGPSAIAALQTMRFQPASETGERFVARMGLRRDPAGTYSVMSETRHRVAGFWDLS